MAAPSGASRLGRRERHPVWSNYALCRLGTRTACGDAQGAGLALAGPLREAWRRPWGPPHGGDELTDAPAEEFLGLDGGRAYLLASLRCGRTSARGSGPDCLADPLRVASSPLTLSVGERGTGSGPDRFRSLASRDSARWLPDGSRSGEATRPSQTSSSVLCGAGVARKPCARPSGPGPQRHHRTKFPR